MREIVYKVKGTSNVKSLAGCIAKSIKGEGETKASDVVLLCCGAQSLNQAVKAIAVARGFLASGGRNAVVRPGFDSTIIDGEDRTIIKLFISLA